VVTARPENKIQSNGQVNNLVVSGVPAGKFLKGVGHPKKEPFFWDQTSIGSFAESIHTDEKSGEYRGVSFVECQQR